MKDYYRQGTLIAFAIVAVAVLVTIGLAMWVNSMTHDDNPKALAPQSVQIPQTTLMGIDLAFTGDPSMK
jgi:hypothetical protein